MNQGGHWVQSTQAQSVLDPIRSMPNSAPGLIHTGLKLVLFNGIGTLSHDSSRGWDECGLAGVFLSLKRRCENVMPFARFVEPGRVALVAEGPLKGKLLWLCTNELGFLELNTNFKFCHH
ncbi:hypothetical protein evm_009145 [Chilo suppressalis]|nr:hypothetical protein evm_009145 [Chilo suppressalis]